GLPVPRIRTCSCTARRLVRHCHALAVVLSLQLRSTTGQHQGTLGGLGNRVLHFYRTPRRRSWPVACRLATSCRNLFRVPAAGITGCSLTIRSSRTCFVTPNTRQEKLAMC